MCDAGEGVVGDVWDGGWKGTLDCERGGFGGDYGGGEGDCAVAWEGGHFCFSMCVGWYDEKERSGYGV